MVPETMTAAVMYAPGDIRVEEASVASPGPDEVLLRVAACGVCGSDIPRMLRNGGYVMPIICGHEFSGYVEQLGEGVTGFELGDLVSVPPLIPCYHCDFCLRGEFGLCENYDYFGSRSNGAYAQYVVSPVGNLLKMPTGIDPRAAIRIGPPIGAIGGAFDQAKIANIARQSGLRGLNTSTPQPFPELLLTRNRFRIHHFEDGRLPIGLHNYAVPNG